MSLTIQEKAAVFDRLARVLKRFAVDMQPILDLGPQRFGEHVEAEAKARATRLFRAWLETTGAIPDMLGWRDEAEGCIEDAVEIGIQAALGIYKPLDGEIPRAEDNPRERAEADDENAATGERSAFQNEQCGDCDSAVADAALFQRAADGLRERSDRPVSAWEKRAYEAEQLAIDLFRRYVDHAPDCAGLTIPRNFSDERCTCGLRLLVEGNQGIVAAAFIAESKEQR